jgi:hypothetical protein
MLRCHPDATDASVENSWSSRLEHRRIEQPALRKIGAR